MPSPATDDPQPSDEIPPMYTPSQLRLLKWAVIGMGVILLLGFMAVIGRIVWLVNQAPRPASQATATAAPPLVAPPPLALPKGAIVRHIALSGHRLAVHYESPAGAGIRIIDLATGLPGVSMPITVDGAAPR